MGLIDRLLGKPTLDDFAGMLIAGLPEGDECRYDSASGEITRHADGKVVGRINPHNMFRTYREASRKERPALLRTFHRALSGMSRQLPEEYEMAKADLRPRLWLRSTEEQMRLRVLVGEAERAPELVSSPIGGHLQVCLSYDWPDSVQTIIPETLERWGATPYEALEDAKANLEAATTGYASLGGRLYSFIEGDSYDASRLVLTERIGSLEVLGRHVAIVTNRNSLLVTGTDDEEGLAMMAALAESGRKEPYPLVPIPMVLEGGEWFDWIPPEGHPLHRAFREMRLEWMSGEYAEQKGLLDRIEEDAFVASFSVVQKGEGLPLSYCVWAEGVDALLPEADKVVLLRSDGGEPAALCRWERLIEVVGDLLGETEHYPPRRRTRGFPDDAQLAALGVEEMCEG